MVDRGIGEKKRSTAAQAALGAGVVAGIFSTVVLVLMAVTFARLDATDPLRAGLLEAKQKRLQQNPGDEELREEIRQLDLLARRAFFDARGFLNTGAFLLLGGLAVLLASLKLRASLLARPRLPGPPQTTTPPGRAWTPAQIALASVGGLAALFALALLLFGPGEVKRAPTAKSDEGTAEGIEPEKLGTAPGREEIVSNWPGFRGPFGLGIAETADPPLDWDGGSGRNVRWKTEVPLPGFSSPAVWKTRVFLTGGDRSLREIYCFDADTGERLWRRTVPPVPGAAVPRVTEDTGYAAPSPATDGRVVCALFATGDLACLDMEGANRWRNRIGDPVNKYGHASSPILWRDLVVVQFDHEEGAWVEAYRLADGKRAWRTEREGEVSWSSPAIVPHEDDDVLLLNGNPFVAAYEAGTGRRLWRVECMMGEVASSPAFFQGIAFAGNENAVLAAIDMKTHEILWETDLDLPDVSSPAASDGRIYVASGGGVLSCYGARDGAEHWVETFAEGFWSSPVVAAGRVYALDRTGVMRIFADAAAYQPLGAPALGEDSLCTPAFVGGRIYVRGDKHLFCIEAGE